jgi:beta-glucosidase
VTGYWTIGCCDHKGTFNAAVNTHHNFNSTEDAVSAAINAGIQLDYGDSVATDITNAITAGKLTEKALDDAVTRTFLTRFRLGEFDEARNPFWQRYDEMLLDSVPHRQHARKAVGASVVLLHNLADVLPLDNGASIKKVAVVGPWSDCKDRTGGYGGSQVGLLCGVVASRTY